ncbi:MAG: magnesium/cobalt transporter CorA [Neisseria sp.]|nr:magnesium/cobalt transporter CorA [Neisseria sp.]
MKKTAKKDYLQDLLTNPSGQARGDTKKQSARHLNITVFSPDGVQIQEFPYDIKQQTLLPPPTDNNVTWYHLVGINDADSLHRLLEPFAVHDLVLEDILNIKQRPKIEDYGTYLFIAATVFGNDGKGMHADQIYLILGKNFIISLQRKPLGLFTPMRKRLHEDFERVHAQGAAFLAYMLLDRMVDDYFVSLDHLTAKTEKLDQKLFAEQGTDMLPRIHRLKRDAVRLRRTLLPLREGLSQIMRGDFPLIPPSVHIFLRDTYDHTLQLSESLDAIRDTVQSMMDVHLSFQSNALNKQMRVLTSITIIFMPLTLIAGIYGMNFDFMPELHWKYGYFIILGLMATLAGGMLWLFNRKRWL